MSQQLQITGGAKVRDLQDVIIGTSGVLSSLAFNVANGVPKLDVNGKILVSQLPNSVMEYLGTWDASTNTPTLVNGTGNQGDVYLCNVAGTVNFGAGPITFAVGDSAIYSGTIWQKAGGATGTVTSVGLTSTGNDAITITGSPITTSGNINLGFAGTNLQYINGAGDLTTFPTLISSIGLTMPSAFSVANSPLTANGTIAVTGAGYPSQYIRGDGTLADFPTSGGGGSSVSYYLNGGTSQGTIGGVTYYEMSKTADTGTGVDFTKSGDGFIVAFLTDAGDPAQLNIPAGNWNYEIYASMSANGGTPEMYAELYKYDGTTFTLISTSSNEILYDGTNLNLYTFAMTVPSTTLAITDRLAVKLYATNSGGKTTTVHTQDSHLCQIITTFSTGITALNGLTAQVQYFATGTSGTDFNISSTTATHTFNIPDASATNRGLITTGTQTIAGLKTITGTSLILAPSAGDGGILNLKRGAYTGGINDYTSITSQGDDLSLVSLTSSTNRSIKFDFSSITSGILRTYTLPNASGTLALLSADQSFTGINSFDYGINYKTGASLANVSGYISQAYAKSGTGAGSTLSLKISDGNSVKSINLDFVGSPATYTYTFPAASGTIALTSDLGSYLPLAGGIMTGSILLNNNLTISGQLFGTSSYASMLAMSPSDKVLIDNSGRGVIFGGTIGQGAYTYNFPSASGTFALTSDIPSLANYVTLTTTQTISGAKTFTSDLNAAKVAIANSNTLYTTTGYTTLSASNVGTTSWIAYVWGNVGGAAAILSFDNTAQYTYTFPAATGTLPLGTGTTNYHAKWTGTSTIGNSLIWDNGTNVGIGTTSPFAIAGLNLSLDNAASSAIQLGVSGVRNAQFYADGAEVRLYAVTNVPIKFGTNDTERMRITSSGNVGIGTSSPNNKLDVSGNTVLNGTVSFGTAAAAANSFTFYQNYSVGQPGTDWYSSTGAVIFGFNGNTKALFLGNLTGGATTLSTDASGNIIRTPSDINLKTNIEDLQYGLETIMQLRPIIHNWKESIDTEEKSINMGEGKSIGFIAQEVELLVPEIVCGDEYKSIDYPKMVAILTKAIQEQQIQIQNLQEQINILQNK